MDLLKYLIIAVIIFLVVGFIIKKKKSKNKLFIFLAGMTVALTVLVLPLYAENNFISQIVFSILYAIQTIFLGQDFELIGQIELNNNINLIYVIVIYILFFLQPLTTATAIISMLGDYISKLQMFLSRDKKALVFSELNDKTLTIAKTQYKKNNNLIVFLGNKDGSEQYKKEIKQLKGVIVEQNISDLNLKNNQVTYYLFSTNEEENLNNALLLLKQNNLQKNVKIYVLNNSEGARIILDSSPKNGVRLELINETDRAIYEHLFNVPIYKNSINNQISILIVGAGKVGMEFLKAVTWCGQLIGHKLNINIVDIKANEIKEKLNINCPELVNNYQYNFIEADIYSEKAIKELDSLKEQNINYILVALDTEAKNIEVAVFLRKYFLRQDTINYVRKPVINLWIENDEKKIQIDTLKHGGKNNSYDLTSFGSISEMYGKHSIVNSNIEELAKQVHFAYNNKRVTDIKATQKILEEFYELEYNKKSSRAVAVHLKYKLYSILKYSYNGNLENDLDNNIDKVLKQYQELAKNQEVIQSLVENEHNRWMAYVRTDGFTKVQKEEVGKYIMHTGNCKYFLAKLHPAIVGNEELENVQEYLKSREYLKEVDGKLQKEKYLKQNYTDSDVDIINNIEKILKKNIYQG